MTRAILAIDQGTTNSKALLVDGRGRILARGSRPVGIAFPRPGWVEQDPGALWTSVLGAVQDCVDAASGVEIAAVGVTNQRESILLWDRRTGEALGPCITWQCRRTTPFCDELKARGLSAWLEGKTGLTIDPLFSASKARWLLDNTPDGHARAEAGELCLGTVDSWLVWKLTAGAVHATDASNAARTQLMDLAHGEWDDELLAIFGVPRAALPQIRPSSGHFGEVATGHIRSGTPIAGVAGDSHAAMFAHAAFAPGQVKATYGTGSSLMTLSNAEGSQAGLSRTVAWRLGGAPVLALEGNIASSGGTVDWLGQTLGKSEPSEDVAALAGGLDDSGGVYIVPAFAGLGAPHWDDRARGLICGLTRGTGPAQLARAALESIAYQVADVFEAMEAASGQHLTTLSADGGASRNSALMQFQADILDRPVIRDRSADLSAVGAAWLAGLAVGVWNGLSELAALPRETDRFEPAMPVAQRRRLRQGWREAIARARLRPSDEEARP